MKVKMSDPDLSKESLEMYTNVEEKATNMTESIKHAIVLLQVNLNPITDPILALPFIIGLGPSFKTGC